MKTIDAIYMEYLSDFEVEFDPARRMYYIRKEDCVTMIAEVDIVSHGTEYRDYTHVTHCAYHDNSLEWQHHLPDPPYCDCPYTMETFDIESSIKYIRDYTNQKILVGDKQ